MTVEHPPSVVTVATRRGASSRFLVHMRYVIGLSIVFGVLTWRSGDVHHGADLVIHALIGLTR